MNERLLHKPDSWAGSTDCYVYVHNPPYIASILFTCVKSMCALRKNYETVDPPLVPFPFYQFIVNKTKKEISYIYWLQ